MCDRSAGFHIVVADVSNRTPPVITTHLHQSRRLMPRSRQCLLDTSEEGTRFSLLTILLPASLTSMFLTCSKDAPHPGWVEFLKSLRPDTLPALRTVTVSQSDLWPTQPSVSHCMQRMYLPADSSCYIFSFLRREVAKHPMPPIAEALLDRGIRLCDASGVGWKPRLQTRRTKK